MEATTKTEAKNIEQQQAPANVEGEEDNWEDDKTTPESTEGLTKKQKENLRKKQKRKEKKEAAKSEPSAVNIEKPLEEIKEEVEGQETAEAPTETKAEPASDFEKELAWCVHQLRLGLQNNTVSKDQCNKFHDKIEIITLFNR